MLDLFKFYQYDVYLDKIYDTQHNYLVWEK